MRKIFIISITVLAGLLIAQKGYGQEDLSSKQIKYWKKKAKMYVKRPEALKSEFENLHNQIEDLKKKNKSLELSGGTGGSPLVDSLMWVLAKQEGEYQNMKKEYDQMKESYQTLKTVNEKGIKEGLVYRVQIGAYVLENDTDYANLDEEKFSIERSDGMYKYILGAFRSYDEAEKFRGKLMQMGMDEPWIVPYIDGIRASMQEAREYMGTQSTDTFYLDE